MAQIDILLASYKGEQYIKTQILSLISQTFTDWNLIIHDDGSLDSTVEIVKKFCNIDKRIRIIEDNIVFQNAAMNFMHLLKYSTAEFIMFCDQDDLWFDNKIELMFSILSKKNQTIPQVVYCNSYVWIPNEGIKGLATLTFPKDLQSFLFLNSGIQGCASIFNKKMLDLLLCWEGECAMHDHLLHLIGLTIGKVTYIHIPLMLYRNHEKNVTGKTATKIISWNKISNHRNIPVVDLRHYNTVKSYVKIYGNKLTINNIRILQQYLSMPKKKIFKRLVIIIKYKFQI
ncbi:MAG: glycosyltransferase, partial [Bacteroidaceae bacterium]|nr:glycosyltransferase [Bacteroidaceae bacterium]